MLGGEFGDRRRLRGLAVHTSEKFIVQLSAPYFNVAYLWVISVLIFSSIRFSHICVIIQWTRKLVHHHFLSRCLTVDLYKPLGLRFECVLYCHHSGLITSLQIGLRCTSVVVSGHWTLVKLWRHCRHLAFYSFRIKKLSSALALW